MKHRLMPTRKSAPALGLLMVVGAAPAGAVDYLNDVLPIMKAHCWDCHSNEESVKGSLALDDLDEVRDYQIGPFNIIRPGKPDESSFLEKMKLPSGHEDFMPRKGEPLPEKELAVIEQWIAEGAVIDARNPSEKEAVFLAQGKAVPMEDERQKFHAWTNTVGKLIEARFVRLRGEAITVVMRDGKSYEVPLQSLSEESRDLAKRLGAGK